MIHSGWRRAKSLLRAAQIKMRRFWAQQRRITCRQLLRLRFHTDRKIISAHQYAIEKINFLASVLVLSLVGVACAALYVVIPRLADLDKKEASIVGLFQGISSGLIGTTVVCISLITFFMQNNLTRLPFSLFSKLSSDKLSILYFIISFIFSITAGMLSIFYKSELGREFIVVFLLLSVSVVACLLLSFNRALRLVNPQYQLRRLIKEEGRSLKWWSKRAEVARPIIGEPQQKNKEKFDYSKRAFFDLNPHAINSLLEALQHVSAFVRQFTAVGDNGTVRQAFNALVALNQLYITERSGTFVADNPFFDSGISTDAVINESLEQIRQLHAAALNTRNETLLEQCYDTYAALGRLYYSIDYGSSRIGNSEKSHSRLAIGYLISDLERALAQTMPDVIMHGVRVLSKIGIELSKKGDHFGAQQVVDALAKCAAPGVLVQDYRPVTKISLEALSEQLVTNLAVADSRFEFLNERILEQVNFICILYLQNKKPELNDTTDFRPDSFYSQTNPNGFTSRISPFINFLLKVDERNAATDEAFGNLEDWAERVALPTRELMKLALEKGSFLGYDLLHWIRQLARFFLALETAPTLPDHMAGKFERHAQWLIPTYTFIETSQRSISSAEQYQLTEVLLAIATDCVKYECNEALSDVLSVCAIWGAMASQHGTGWTTLEDVTFGIAAIAAIAEARGHPVNLSAILQKRRHESFNIPLDEIQRVLEAVSGFKRGHREYRGIRSELNALVQAADQEAMARYLDLVITDWFPSQTHNA